MDFITFIRKPFVVEAVEVTEDNIAEIAELVGTLQKKEDGTSYIEVNRDMFRNIKQISPGFWMTMMGGNIRCYSRPVFKKQFMETNDHIKVWIETLSKFNKKEGAHG